MKLKVVVLILTLLILTSACASLKSGWGRLFGGGGEVGGSGVILRFLEAPNDGQEIREGRPFSVRIEIENYVTSQPGLTGELCLRDRRISRSPDDGIRDDGDCRQVNLPPATIVEDKVYSSKDDSFVFGPYRYSNIEKEFAEEVVIYADLKYEIQTTAGASTCIKKLAAEGADIPENCGETQNLVVKQIDLPLKVSKITAESAPSEFSSMIYLEILLTKTREGQILSKSSILDQQINTNTADVDFNVEIGGQTATCPSVGTSLQIRQSEDNKVIECYTEIPLNQNSIDVPIRIKMGYGFIQTIQGPTIKLVKGAS